MTVRRMIINGTRALVAFSTEEIPQGRKGNVESEACELARDMYWLDTGVDLSPLADLEPVSRALN